MTFDEFTADIEEIGWTFTHLINLRPGYQINLANDTHVIVATGVTIESAFASAKSKALNGEYTGQLFSLGRLMSPELRMEGSSLLAQLGLLKKEKPFDRRM